MYVSVNRETCQFLHKHENYRLVADLDFIEAPGKTVDLGPIDSPQTFLRGWTELELQLLYKHTTGEDHSPYSGDKLRAVLAELAEKLPVSDANAFEADRQADYIEKRHKDGAEGYVYVKGATLPGKKAELFDGTLRANITPEAAALAASKRAAPASYRAPPQSAAQGAVNAAPRSAPRNAPRAGGVRETIWKVADELWEKAGKTKDKSAILALRKRIMDILETDHQVKRTSSSNELGNWQKARV